ncbi:MAG: class I SAM-dependent methyltransferase [Actinomycetota bacterium]
MGAAAREAGSEWSLVADANRLPLPSDSVGLAIAFMSLMDVDDPSAAIKEVARVLGPGGRFVSRFVTRSTQRVRGRAALRRVLFASLTRIWTRAFESTVTTGTECR